MASLMRRGGSCVLTVMLVANLASAVEVIGWRGDGTGRYPSSRPPQTWSKDTNVVWKTDLPGGGYSSPVLAGELILLTVEPTHVLCISATSGSVVWQQSATYAAALGEAKSAEIEAAYGKFNEEQRAIRKRQDALDKDKPDPAEVEAIKVAQGEIEKRKQEYSRQFPQEKHGGAGNASATPACDGERVFAVFNTGVVAAFDVRGGERLWIRHSEVSQLGFGHSSSPVLAGGKLIVHVKDLLALDPATGKEVWRAKSPAKHGTPAVTQVAGEDLIITPSGSLVRANDGRILAEKLFDLSENSPLIQDGIVYAHESGKTKAFRLPVSLDAAIEKQPLWESTSTREQRMASAVCYDGLLYSGTRSGIMDVTDATSGKVVYRKRLEIGELFSSMVLAGNAIVINGRDGKTILLRPGREFEEIQLNELGRTSSTPIFAGQRMYLRADKSLYCIGE